MGLVIYGNEIESNGRQFKNYIQNMQSAVSKTLQTIENAINDNSLNSSSYNSLKMFLLTTYYPLYIRIQNAVNSLGTATDVVLNAYTSSGINGGEILKEDELVQKISNLESTISSLESSLQSLGKTVGVNALALSTAIGNLRRQVGILKNKLNQMYQFNSDGSGKYQEAISILTTCKSQAKRRSLNGTNVLSYVEQLNLNVKPEILPIVMNDIKHDIEKYGKSIWEYHTKDYYLETVLANGTYNIEKYQEKLNNVLISRGYGTRNAVVSAARFLALRYPKLRYFWGGKSFHSASNNVLGSNGVTEGINPDWGKPAVVTAGGSRTTGTAVPLGMDCAGFVAWTLQTAKCVDPNNPLKWSTVLAQTQATELGDYACMIPKDSPNYSSVVQHSKPMIDYNPDNVKPGDLVSIFGGNEHIGIIIGRNDDKIACAHSSGSGGGTSVDIINVNTGECYTRNSDIYFTHVTYMDDYYAQFGQ